jgi:hypothetical protein
MPAADVSGFVLEAEDVVARTIDLEAVDLRGWNWGLGLNGASGTTDKVSILSRLSWVWSLTFCLWT